MEEIVRRGVRGRWRRLFDDVDPKNAIIGAYTVRVPDPKPMPNVFNLGCIGWLVRVFPSKVTTHRLRRWKRISWRWGERGRRCDRRGRRQLSCNNRVIISQGR